MADSPFARCDLPGLRPAQLTFAAVLLLLLTAGLLFFSRLQSPLLEPEDAVYAEVSRQMWTRGEWLIPLRDGRAYYEKPPLLYWLIMACYAAFGVHDWAARLIPCFSGLGIVLVTFFWGKRLLGFRAGLAGALILCLSARFVHQARMITMDPLFTFWILVGLAFGQGAIQSGRLAWRAWILSALAAGLGMLTKGPAALVLVAVPLLAYQFLNKRTARPTVRAWLAYLGAALGLLLPWCVPLAWHDPGFLREFFWNHHVVLRFVQPLHPQPVWFYLPALLFGMLPWTLLVPDLIRVLRRSEPKPAELGFLLLCCGWCLVFFSAASCKRIAYILPAMPIFALALGYALDKRLPGCSLGDLFRRGQGFGFPYWATHGVLAAGMVIFLVAGFTGLAKPAQGVGLAALAAAGAVWLIMFRSRHAWAGCWAACAMATFLLLFLSVQVLLPGYYRRFSLRSQARCFLESDIPVVCHPHQCDSVSFYLGRHDIRSYGRDERDRLIADLQSRPETIMFVKSGHVLDDLLRLLPDSLEFVPRGRSSWMTAGLVRRRPLTAGISHCP